MSWRSSSSYRRWKKKVIARDKCCQLCGTKGKLHAHHLNHATFFPEQKFWVKNGVALCQDCHIHFHCSYKNSTREKCTRKDWFNFIELMTWYKEKLL